ncbi:lipocalin/fatty acid-binding family protein [Yersinia intermedia]|uniref:Uncharacterized protein n=1 Tax=Yersinia intermedia TaxID=631 RepID=A0ABX6FBP6_YERIN|nr:hypothetical protein [Yersinia intermedia]QGR67319.1 hypothetical protein FOC38_16060 [Yersinia intermedia]QGR72335.1 hypothetical protein FOC37_19360 [Yersinia intermedia]CRY80401.1 Uncharacterised protein [Yersinia intermedia]
MQPISNELTVATINLTQKNTPLSGENNNSPILNSKIEATAYIKSLIQDQYSSQFDVENTIGELNGRIEISLNTLEFGVSEKLYYVTANMDPRNFFYLEEGADNHWDINTLNIKDNHTRQVVFIFDTNLPSATLPVDMKLVTERIEELNGVYYVHCNPEIKFSLHELTFKNEEIKQKSDLINSFKLDPQRKEKLIELLKNCSSRNKFCSNNDAVELCKNFRDLFDSTDEITPQMQRNTLKLANELAKSH